MTLANAKSKIIKGMILDFDGIILESVEIKGQAFKILFKDFPQYQDAIFKYHLRNGGVSRYIKIRHIYKEFLRKPLSAEKYKTLCQQYSTIVLKLVLKCPFVSGAKEFLEDISQKCALFVISATPHEEINFIIDKLGLRSFFKGVYGSPISKKQWTKKIMVQNDFEADDLFWIGDSMSDYEAARAHNIRFIKREMNGKSGLADVAAFHEIKDLNDLSCFVQEYL